MTAVVIENLDEENLIVRRASLTALGERKARRAVPAMIAAALVVGTLARENRKLGRTVLAIARLSARFSARKEHKEEE